MENKPSALLLMKSETAPSVSSSGGGDHLVVTDGNQSIWTGSFLVMTENAKKLSPILARQINTSRASERDPKELMSQLRLLHLRNTMDIEEIVPSLSSAISNVGSETEALLLEEPTKAAARKPTKSWEQKRRSGYNASQTFVKKLDAKDPRSLTEREDHLRKQHVANVKRFENRLKKETNLKSADVGGRKSSKGGESSKGEQDPVSDDPPAQPYTGTSSKPQATEEPNAKRLRSYDEQGTENKRIKPSPSLNSHSQLQIAIVDRSQGDVIFVMQVFPSDAIPCDSCGNECANACGTKHFRTCCFNYLRKRTDPSAMKLITNKRLIDFIMLQGRALYTQDELSREKDERRLREARKNDTMMDVNLERYYG